MEYSQSKDGPPKIIQIQVDGDYVYGLGDDGVVYSSYNFSDW